MLATRDKRRHACVLVPLLLLELMHQTRICRHDVLSLTCHPFAVRFVASDFRVLVARHSFRETHGVTSSRWLVAVLLSDQDQRRSMSMEL